jgi:DNA-binding transcriptional MerR regulator
MFTVDFAADFSGLTEARINALEKKGILSPEKHSRSRYYTYGDIYILRIVKILRLSGIRLANIEAAYAYLKGLKPDQPLTSFILLHDGNEVYALVDGNTVSATRYGQMIIKGTIKMIAVGSELESLRRKMNRYVDSVKKSASDLKKKALKRYSVEDLSKLLA